MATIFTKIINREIPATIVFENDKVIAFKDINPAAPVHILVVPKKEISTINDIKPEDKDIIGEMYLAIGEITKKLGIAEEHEYEKEGKSLTKLQNHIKGRY